jgi:hypothetical protein
LQVTRKNLKRSQIQRRAPMTSLMRTSDALIRMNGLDD